MKRWFLWVCLMAFAMLAVSQERTVVRFTGVSEDGLRCPFDVVNVTNITRGWNETLVYPDTVIVLSGLGVEEHLSVCEGITRVYPNPSSDFSNVEFGILQSGVVEISVVGIDGVRKASWEGYLSSGRHQVRITLDKPQMAFVVVTTEKERYVGKLLHMGHHGKNELDLCSISLGLSERSNGVDRLDANDGFMPGDILCYEGVLLNNGNLLYSKKVTQAQYANETISLVFPVNKPAVTLVEVTDVTQHSAKVVGNVTDSGGLTVTERGVVIYSNPQYFYQLAGSGTGRFEIELTDLTGNTTYYVSVYADNGLGRTFSDQMVFTTLPDIPGPPIGDVFTIDQILDMTPGTVFANDASVYGIITADEQSGNLFKTAFLQDRTTGKAIELSMNATCGVRIGDSIRVCLKDVTYSIYHGLPQLVNFNPYEHLVILDVDKPIQPVETSIAELDAGNHLAGLVKLKNVRFPEQGTFADPAGYGNRTLLDSTGQMIIVRTSNYANFAYDSLPRGKGDVVAIASVYNQTRQLILRSADDLEFDGNPDDDDNIQSLPYYQWFATDFGTYTPYDVLGPQSWVIDYQTAKMSGYENGVCYPNDDWLISSPVAITGVEDAKMSMVYIGRYFDDINENITIWASNDYFGGSDPTTATWSRLPAVLCEGSNWVDFQMAEFALTDYVGQTITLAVRYTSTDSEAGTVEIQRIFIEEGTAGDGPFPPSEVQSLPYSQDFSEQFGTYATFDVLGPQSWEIDYQTAKMTGYAGGANHANEDWLISSPVAVTGVNEAKVSVCYAAQYQNSDPRDVVLEVSTDYTFGTDPATATWTQMSATYPNTANWSDFQTVETSLNDFVGNIVTVAIKYNSTDAQSRTFEVKSITVQEGHAEDGGDTPDPPTPPTPHEVEGSGTQDDPYNVAAGIGHQNEELVAWVRGYIVGAVKNGSTSVNSNDQINWSAPFDLATNVVIADDVDCREISQCIIVNLPAGKPLRAQVNLVDHPDNWGKRLAVNGKLRNYFGQAGLRDSGGTENDFVLE